MTASTRLVKGTDFICIGTQDFFKDPDGNALSIHHRYAPQG
ncbi:MAG: hypothetical protein ACR2G3_09685 [Solirubrobacterales bacterium]